MQRKRPLVVLGTIVLAATAAATAALASGAVDRDTPITGEALTKASNAALEHLGGGTVTGTEVGDEESLYEVEVTLADGRRVDVQLDASFGVVGTEADVEDEADTDGDPSDDGGR